MAFAHAGNILPAAIAHIDAAAHALSNR
jgi:hypothetical protein